MPKNNMKCVRMTDEVYDYINGFHGIGFNQRFENLVYFCMEEEESIKTDIDRLQREKSALIDEILMFRKLREEIRYIDTRVRAITDTAVKFTVLPGQQAI